MFIYMSDDTQCSQSSNKVISTSTVILVQSEGASVVGKGGVVNKD